MPREWDEYTRVDAAECLLMAGVVLPAASVFVLVDSVVERAQKWGQDSGRYLLRRTLALCLFIDAPAAGITKMRDVLGKWQLAGYELRELITAPGESRSEVAVDLLCELAHATCRT